MSITVKDCLQLPSLSLGRVIAGHGGLGNIVTNVSVMEFNDTDEADILSPNELLISALYCVKDDVDAQCRLIQKARRSGDVGLVLFYSEQILKEVSPRLLRIADHLNFPIIIMPGNDMGLKYSDVISDVTEAIYMDRSAELFFVSDTMKLLSQSPEQERTPAMVLKLASNYARAAFFLCDEYENPMAVSFWPATNYMDISEAISICENGEKNGVRVLRRRFRDKKDTQLVLYAASGNRKLNASILSEVVEAIQIFSLVWNYNMNPDTPKSLIPALLRGKAELVRYICSRNHIDACCLNKMLLLELLSPEDISSSGLLTSCIRDLFTEAGKQAVYDVFGSYFVILYESESSVKDRIMEESLFEILERQESVLTCTAFASSKLVEDAAGFYGVFCENLHIAKQIFPGKKRFTYSDIYFANRAETAILSIENQDHYYGELFLPIVKSGEEELMPTLVTYLLDCNSEIKTTAETLFLHRNTVLYRLNKIRTLLGCDLAEMPMAYDIYLAAAIYRMQNGK